MDQNEMTDELIMAYADGELTADEAARVEEALKTDQSAQRKLAMFRETADLLKAAPAPPVPDDLAHRIDALIADKDDEPAPAETDNVVQFRRFGRSRFVPTAIAACLALAIGLGTGYSLNQPEPAGKGSPFGVAALADPGIKGALASTPSGESSVLASGATLNLIASFMDEAGVLCREFDYEGVNGHSVVSVACRDGGQWQPKIAIAATGDSANHYAPASSLDALEAWLKSSGLGDPLGAEDEQQLLAVR